MKTMMICNLTDLEKSFLIKRTSPSTLKDSRLSTRLRCARTGKPLVIACSKLVAHSLMESMNYNRNSISLRTIRLSFARDSMKICTVLMALDASSSTKK
jgi:hypothetical protein